MFGEIVFGAARREKKSTVPATRRLAYHRSIRLEALEDRRMLSIGSYPEIPGMVLVDPNTDNLRGQVIYLDYDGEENVTYNGPVTVGPFDVPPLAAPGELAGQEDAVMADVVQQLNELFESVEVTFTLDRPGVVAAYSTIYIGGTDTLFQQYGCFAGLAETVDVGNANPSDNALLFSDLLFGVEYTSIGNYTPFSALLARIKSDFLHHILCKHRYASTIQRIAEKVALN
jgi:hypothetical protein